ncbi:MAG: transporter permease [Propionibacteriaceae bacterium]|jgi:ABC-type Fe3+-siderophore transport system permease subunit|nr:transporter permease [Propionibacteriaceae bacterium]
MAVTVKPSKITTRSEAARPDLRSVRRPTPVTACAFVVIMVGWLAVIGTVHLTQGTSEVGPVDVWRVATGQGSDQALAVVLASRVPRLLAGLVVGMALGVAGAVLQAVVRNPLAAPDTLAVNAGAYLALTACAAFGISLPLFGSASIAFLGGLAAAAVVLGLSAGGAAATIRLVLAGSVIALGLASISSVLLLIFSQESRGLFAWGAGSLGQSGLSSVAWMSVVVALAVAAVIAMGRRLDLLQLGDEAAQALGLNVSGTRAVLVVVAVLLSAAAVTVSGPIGFVGLCAPALVRISVRWVPALRRHRLMVLISGLAGVAMVLSADVLLRAVAGPISGIEIPTGVVTTFVGAIVLVLLAQRMRPGGGPGSLATMRAGSRFGLRHPGPLVAITAVVLAGLIISAVLVGDSWLLLGDVSNWLNHVASPRITLILDARMPRIAAALLAGASLAIAGAVVQAVTRNPLSDPGLLGVSAGAGAGGITVLLFVSGASFAAILGGAILGALVAALVVFGLSAGGSLDQTRMVLVGIGVSAGGAALTTLMIVGTEPWNQTRAITWLGGSTFGATWVQQLPMIVALVVSLAILAGARQDLDLLQLDEETPHILGVAVGPTRLVVLSVAVLLTAAATASVGVIAFVGLVAPHAARLLIGRQHHWMLPMAALLGALLVLLADTLGRTALAPMQLPAGLVTALVGAPYFVWLLGRVKA